jgi:hypothetical protein
MAEYACKIIQASDFSFNDILRYRAEELSQKALFIDMGKFTPKSFSTNKYGTIKRNCYCYLQERSRLTSFSYFLRKFSESAIVDIAATRLGYSCFSLMSILLTTNLPLFSK